jgi:quercetin dioxygenase-like cupin family protein
MSTTSPNGMADVQPHLTRLAELVTEMADNRVRYQLAVGDCDGVGLMSDDGVGVQRAVMTAGAVFPEHVHEEYECLVVYRGELRVVMSGVSTIVTAPGVACIPAGVAHLVIAPVETHMIATTIPIAPGYPHARP